MRYRELSETPLADLDAIGDLDNAGSFRSDDLRAMRNSKWREKVFHAFRQTPFLFNIYLYNGPEGVAPVGHGYNFAGDSLKVNDLANLKKYVGVQTLRVVRDIIGRVPPDAANSITVLLVQNEGAERVALTPWILAHRVAHAILYAGQERGAIGFDGKIAGALQMLNRSVESMFSIVERNLSASRHGAQQDPRARINAIGKLIGGFRSARMGMIRDTGEFVVELVTQFLIQGRVRFERPILDDRGRTEPPGPEIDADLLAMARKHRKNKEGFVKEALRTRYRFATVPTKPRFDADSYIGYDAEGQAVAAFGADRLEQNRQRYARIAPAPPPTRQAVARWTTYQKRKTELENLFDLFWERNWVFPDITATDGLDMNLSECETNLNTAIDTMLKACVGKALVL